MSGYRRFISYVYEYVQEQKGSNKGYIKVEVRDGLCRMHFYLQGKVLGEACKGKVYAVVREKGKSRLLELAAVDLFGEKLEFQLEMPETNVGQSEYAVSELAGIFIKGDEVCYLTQWDDEPLSLCDFTMQEEMEEVPESDLQAEEVRMPEDDGKEEESQLQKLHADWDYLPFADDEISECKKITLQDISFRNNFLVYGFEQYQHLLLGYMEKEGQYILGVPGVYAPQEKFMAGVFGFPYFKAMIKKEQTADGQPAGYTFGYWYRLIKPSDLYFWNGFKKERTEFF